MGTAGDADSSDDDIEIVPKSVDNYWLEHGDETPVSFASLPYFKPGEENLRNQSVFVRGTQDNGMRLYMRAVAWKLEFTKDVKPVFYLKTEKYWIELKKPRKSFETTIRSIMSMAMFLNYALMNPGEREKVAWNHVKEVFKTWDVTPSRDDLASHLHVVQHLIESNTSLASSSALKTIHTGIPRKRLASAREDAQQSSELHQYKYEEKHLHDEEKLGLDEFGDFVETVCCICDDGGDVICCDGPCMRSFHVKGASASCSTVGLSKIDADRMDKFFCPNCKFKRHQCFACGELGCSDDTTNATCEVFLCGVAMCGHFYHPSCVAKLVLKDKDTCEQVALAKSIKDGKKFVCPMHNCCKCGKEEVKEATNLQFGICRRCPRVWHRQCLPSFLLHDVPKRCWYDLLPNKILVYCEQHTIIPELATPARNHVKFPEGSMPSVHKRIVKRKAEEEEKKSRPSKLVSLKKQVGTNLKSPSGHIAAKLSEKKRKPFSSLKQTKPEGLEPTKSKRSQGGIAPCSSTAKARGQLSAVNLVKERTNVGFSAKQELPSQKNVQKCNSASKGRSKLDTKLARTRVVVAKSQTPAKSASHPLLQRNKALVHKAASVDIETKSMMDDMIERAKVLVNIENALIKHNAPADSAQYSENQDRKDSLVKLESTIKRMSKAIETLENGGSIEDAKLQCPVDHISDIKSCMEDLKFYLAPLLHGGRSIPSPQHFTKPEQLKAIVDRLHWYFEEGDMILDFACGSNDFFLLMKKKLDESGKACEYRSFDLNQTSNDCNFSKLDWFEMKPSELPDGDRLIMFLNPPFGLKRHMANPFIDYALTFKPKLVVLIAPKEVQSLNQKHDMYELIWEDSNLLRGPSFYLPDVDENILNHWSGEPCHLYLWSRSDWILKYKLIALDQGHIFRLSSSHFAGSPWKALSLDVEKDRNVEAAAGLGGEEEMGDLGKSKHDQPQGESVIANESTGGGKVIGDLDKSTSGMLQVEHMIKNEPTDGEGSVTNLDTSSVSKLDHIPRRRELLECDGPTFDMQVIDDRMKSSKVKSMTNYSDNDCFVPLKQHKNMKKLGVDPSIVEPSGAQFNRNSFQESPEKARKSSRHDVLTTERKTSGKDICGDDKKNDELAHASHQRKITTGKYLDNKEGDVGGRKLSDIQDMYEAGQIESPVKYCMSKQGGERKISTERSQHGCMAKERWTELPEEACPSPVVDLEKQFVSKNDDYAKSEQPKSILRPDNIAGQESLRAQKAQRPDPSRGCNAQLPGHYNSAAFATLNRHSGLHSPHSPSGMQDINFVNYGYRMEHPYGSSAVGRVHFRPQYLQSHLYMGPSNNIPPNAAPFYPPPGPMHLPPGYRSFQPNQYAPLDFQGNFVPIQPQYPPFLERLPNQTNTGGWFDD